MARALELALALIALVTLPCAIAAMICADEAIATVRAKVRRRREEWTQQRALDRLERSFTQPRQRVPQVSQLHALAGTSPARRPTDDISGWLASHAAALRSSASVLLRALPGGRPSHAEAAEAVWPPIEQIAADLRRLRTERLAPGPRDAVWREKIDEGYDVRLREACLALGIPQYLDQLAGVDRHIERVRVEGELINAGMRLQ